MDPFYDESVLSITGLIKQKNCISESDLKTGEVQTDVLVTVFEVTAFPACKSPGGRCCNSLACVYVCLTNNCAYTLSKSLSGDRFGDPAEARVSPTYTHMRAPRTAVGYSDPRRDRGMSSVSQLPWQRP